MKNTIISFIAGIVFVLVGDGIQESNRQKEITRLNLELRLLKELHDSEYKQASETYVRLNDLYYNLRKGCAK